MRRRRQGTTNERVGQDMRRLTLLLATMGMALLLITGIAIADTINCFSNRACIGTNGPDILQGTSHGDWIQAMQGSDELYGHEGFDTLDGDDFEASDTSTDGNDHIGAGRSSDELYGYGGNDTLLGRSGSDFIFAEESSKNEGVDVVRGHESNDFILARDGVKDTIGCGTGQHDTVSFDNGGIDTVADNCERKRGGVYSAAASF